MKIYETIVECDIDFPLQLPSGPLARCVAKLSSSVPAELEQSITCGFPLYFSHTRAVYLYSDREFDCSKEGQPWCYEVKDVLRFYWRGGESTIYYELGEKGDANLISFWFIHQLLPLYLTLEEKYDFLHAGSIEIDGKPVLFIAPSMGGKSTLTDYFIKQGHTLVSDDKVATFLENDLFYAVGSHPYHRPYRRHEELGYRVKHFVTEPKPIHAFYKLESANANADILIEEVNGFQKFNEIMPNYLYATTFMRKKRLQYIGLMLNETRVFRVQLPWDMERLGEVHDAICMHSTLLK